MAATSLAGGALATLMAATPAIAVDATWNAAGTGDYNTAANWTPATVPDGTANFGLSAQNAVTVSAPATVGGWTFGVGASAYAFAINDDFTFNGAGIVINGGSATLTNNVGQLAFVSTSTAGTATFVNNSLLRFNDSSTADRATFTNLSGLRFQDTASAGSATIENDVILEFRNSSTADNANITSLNGGNVQFYNSSTAGSATINVTDGYVLFRSTTTASSATITANNAGTIYFSGNSTGDSAQLTANAGGTVDFSDSAGPLGDGRLSAGSIAGAGEFVLGSREVTVGGNNLSTEVSGAITDGFATGGSLIKAGTGTLTLSGTNTYTGLTTVSAGGLRVDGSIASSSGVAVNGGVLSGTGTVRNVSVNGGVFAPGNGTAVTTAPTVNGTLGFSNGGIYRVFVDPTASSSSNVTGVATLTGGTVNAQFAAGAYTQRSYTILTAGTRTGTFDTLTTNNLPANFAASLSYATANAVTLDLTLTSAPGSALPPNQQGAANAITNFFNNGGALPPGFVTLLGLSGTQQQQAFAQVSGEGSAAGPTQTSFQAANAFLGLLLDPFIDSRGGEQAEGGASNFAAEAMAYVKLRDRDASDAYAAVTPRDRRYDSTFDRRWSVWASGYGGTSTVDGNTAVGTSSTTSRIYGTAVGADYRLSRNTLVGFALGGAGTSFGTSQGLGTGRAGLFQAGAIARHTIGPAYISGALAYGWQDTTTERTVTVAGTDNLQGKFDAQTVAARGEAGYRLANPLGDMPLSGLTPYGALQVTRVHVPGYAESASNGSNQFALAFAQNNTTNLRSELGLRGDTSFLMRQGILALRGRAAFANDSNTDRGVNPTFQALPGSASFTVNGAMPSPDSALLSAGAEMKWRNGWSVSASYEGEFSRTTSSNAGKGTVRYVW